MSGPRYRLETSAPGGGSGGGGDGGFGQNLSVEYQGKGRDFTYTGSGMKKGTHVFDGRQQRQPVVRKVVDYTHALIVYVFHRFPLPSILLLSLFTTFLAPFLPRPQPSPLSSPPPCIIIPLHFISPSIVTFRIVIINEIVVICQLYSLPWIPYVISLSYQRQPTSQRPLIVLNILPSLLINCLILFMSFVGPLGVEDWSQAHIKANLHCGKGQHSTLRQLCKPMIIVYVLWNGVIIRHGWYQVMIEG